VGGWGVLSCIVDHIQQEFNTLFLTRFRTYKIATQPQTKTPVKTTFRDRCFYSSFLHLYTPLYLDWEDEGEEGRLRPAFTVKTSGRPNWQTTRNLFEKTTNKIKIQQSLFFFFCSLFEI
jgi:hypothetical protein